MNIEQIIFNIIKDNAHRWVRYWKNNELKGLTLPGEYIEIRCSFMGGQILNPLLDNGFKVDKIQSKRIDADSYCDVLLKREFIQEGATE